MAVGYETCVIFWRVCSFPYQLRDEISFPKHLIANLPKILHLIVINRNEYNTVLCQQISGNFQPWVDHVQPVRVEPAVAFGVDLVVLQDHIPVFIEHPALVSELAGGLAEVILIDKVVASVVRRIDVDHLDLSKIVLPKKFEHLKVVTLNVEIPGVVEVHTAFPVWSKSHICWRICYSHSLTLPRPSELIPLLLPLDNAL